MAYLVANDFRAGSFNAACAGLLLTDDQVNDTRLTAGIATISQRIDDLTKDFFSKQTLSLEHDVASASQRLYLRRRCTAVTAVKTRYFDGTLTTQDPAAFRLRSSLDSAGAVKLFDSDYLEITVYGIGLVGILPGPWTWQGPWTWPVGTETVQVTGDFGWTVTPGDIKRATALMVWDLFFPQAGELQRASRYARGDITVEVAMDTLTGIPEADSILKTYMRESSVLIG